MADLQKIIVSDAPEQFEIVYEGETFQFEIKKLPWLLVTKILSRATYYTKEGGKVDMDVYYEEYLCSALTKAPWNLAETRFILRKLKPEFGDLLENHVPKPGEAEAGQVDFFAKGSGESCPGESTT